MAPPPHVRMRVPGVEVQEAHSETTPERPSTVRACPAMDEHTLAPSDGFLHALEERVEVTQEVALLLSAAHLRSSDDEAHSLWGVGPPLLPRRPRRTRPESGVHVEALRCCRYN